MRHFYYLLIIGFFLIGGCSSSQKRPETVSLAQAQTAVAEETQPEEKQPVFFNETAPHIVTTKTIKEPSQPISKPTKEPVAELSISEVIKQARQNQTLPEPVPDKPSFKDEETIPLKDRHISPFAYEPLVQSLTEAPWSGEELKYGVYYSFVKAGTAYIKNRGLTTLNGRAAYLIQTTAFSASVIDTVFKVRDINYSWLDATNFYSLGYNQSLREGNYVRDEWVVFDYDNNRYYGEVKKKEDPREISGPLTGQVLDILSSLYYVRTHELEVGKDIVLDIINREEKYPLIVKVLKKETIKTPAGKFDCVVVEPQFRGEGIFVSKGKSLKVWLTNDFYKMPVKMQTEVFIGSVSAELLEYKRN